MKKKIILFHSSAGLYGSDRVFYEVVKHLKIKYQLLVVLAEDGRLRERIGNLDIAVIVTDLAVFRRREFRLNIFFYIQKYIDVKKIVENYQPDLIYSNTSVIPLVGLVSKFLKVKSICHIREVYSEWSLLWFIYQWYLIWAFDRLIVISQAVKSQFINHERLSLCYDGIDLCGVEKIRENIIEKELVYGYVGRLSYKKGVDIVIQAFSRTLQINPNVKLVIIGAPYRTDGDYKISLKELVVNLGIVDSVDFLDEIEDCNYIYSYLDVVVVGTRNIEPLGLVIMEAMARGKLVIAPDIGGPAELIKTNTSGLLFNSGEVESLYNQMVKAQKEDLLSNIGNNAEKYAKENFSLQKSMKKLSIIIEGVI